MLSACQRFGSSKPKPCRHSGARTRRAWGLGLVNIIDRHTRAGGYPVRRRFSAPSQALWNTGSSAFADDDGCKRPGMTKGKRARRHDYRKILPLPLIARQQSLHRARPSRQLALARGLAHRGLEAMLEAPVVGEFGGLGIDARREPREIGGAEGGGFLDHRAIDRRVQKVSE